MGRRDEELDRATGYRDREDAANDRAYTGTAPCPACGGEVWTFGWGKRLCVTCGNRTDGR